MSVFLRNEKRSKNIAYREKKVQRHGADKGKALSDGQQSLVWLEQRVSEMNGAHLLGAFLSCSSVFAFSCSVVPKAFTGRNNLDYLEGKAIS